MVVCATRHNRLKRAVFKIPGFVCKCFLTILPHPIPALLLVLFFVRSLTLVPCSLLRICTEPLAMQANVVVVFWPLINIIQKEGQ